MLKLLSVFGLLLILAFLNFSVFAQRAGKQSFIEIPFEFYRQSVIIQVKVASHGPYNFLLDTGTSPSALDLETAKEIGLKFKEIDVGGSGTGSERITSYQLLLPQIEIGRFRAKNIEALTVESLSRISEQLGKPIKGVLGYSLLKNRIVQFNYRK